MTLLVAIGVLIGLVLGLLGGGGSILMLPALVYVAGVPIHKAIILSLDVIGGTSLIGGIKNWLRGNVNPKAVLLFSITGTVGALVGARFTYLVSPQTIMFAFAALMGVVGKHMLRKHQGKQVSEADQCRIGLCLMTGFAVGILTGFLGVGGGFVVVPALTAFAKLPLKTAIGTSLMIISISSLAGLLGHFSEHVLDAQLAVILITSSMVGMLAGMGMSFSFSARQLRVGFGWLVLTLAAIVTLRNLNF